MPCASLCADNFTRLIFRFLSAVAVALHEASVFKVTSEASGRTRVKVALRGGLAALP